MVLVKRIAAPPMLSLPPAKPHDLDAEAVMNIPSTPDEAASAAPRSPRMLDHPKAVHLLLQVLSKRLWERWLRKGSLPPQVGFAAPSTPLAEPSPLTPPDVFFLSKRTSFFRSC